MINCLLNFNERYTNLSGDIIYNKTLLNHGPRGVNYLLKPISWDYTSPIHQLKKFFLYRLRQMSSLPSILQKIIEYELYYTEMILSEDIDILHSQYWPVIIRGRKNVPIIYSQAGFFQNWCEYRRIHQGIPWYKFSTLAYCLQKYASKVHKIIFWTELSRKNSIRYASISPEKVITIPPGIQIPQKISIPEGDALSILFIGLDYQRKGLSQLVDAFEVLSKRYDFISLHIIGPKVPPSSLIYKTINQNKRIHYHKAVPNTELDKYYRQAAILALPTYAETYGLVIPEAMSYQIPIISTQIPPITELVKNNYSGLLIQPGSLESLTINLEKLIVDTSLRNKLGYNARQMVIKKNSFDVVNKKLYETYESSLHR